MIGRVLLWLRRFTKSIEGYKDEYWDQIRSNSHLDSSFRAGHFPPDETHNWRGLQPWQAGWLLAFAGIDNLCHSEA